MYYQKIGNGTPVVFLHGWGCDGNIFMPIASKLQNFSCFLPDFNGFGKSPKPPKKGWSVEEYAEALYVFFVEHNLQRASIVAHSFGCRVAIVFAAKFPSLVEKMLLFAPAGIRNFSFSRWFKVKMYKISRIFHPKNQSLQTKFGSADYLACDEQMRTTFVKVVNQDLSSFAKKVRCPTLIVNGKFDASTPLSHAERLQKLLPHGALVAIEGGHFDFFANPTAFAQTISFFLEAKS